MAGNLFAFRPTGFFSDRRVFMFPSSCLTSAPPPKVDNFTSTAVSSTNGFPESTSMEVFSPPTSGEQTFLWPDASTVFDEPPSAFGLRRSVSDGNVATSVAQQSVTKPPRNRKQRGSQSSIASVSSNGSQPRRHRRPQATFSSAPVSPSCSRPTSPLTTHGGNPRPTRSAAEVLHDAQRAIIIGEENKAAQCAKRDSTPSGLMLCASSVEPPTSKELCTVMSYYSPVQLSPGAPAAAALAQPELHSDVLLRLASSVRTGCIKSAVVLCRGGAACPTHPAGSTLGEQTSLLMARLHAQETNSRPLLVHLDLRSSGFIAPSSPSSLVMSLSQLRPDAAPSPKAPESNVVSVAWPAQAALGDAEVMSVFRTLIVPMALAFSPDVVFFYVKVSPEFSPAAYARMVRALMVLAHGRIVLLLNVAGDDPHGSLCAAAAMLTLLGGDPPLLPQQELCCDLGTMKLLENIIPPLAPIWPCLSSTISFRLLSEKQFYTVQGDDTVMATVALASLSMTSVREEDEDAFFDGNRKRALSASVTGGAAALLKVVRNSTSSSPVS